VLSCLEGEKQKMARDMEESKLQLRNFKVNKMIVLLNSMVTRSQRNHKYQCFSHMQAFYLELDLKFKKL
jgi:hypothetical protein